MVGLDWAEPMMNFLLHVTFSCIPHAYVLYFQYTCYIWNVLRLFWLFLSLPLFSIEFFLDRSSIVASVDVYYARHLLNTCLDTSLHLYLSRFTDLLYKGSARFVSHFSRSLSWQTRLFTSQTSLTLSKLLPQGFFKVFPSFSSLGEFLISHFHAFYVLKPRFLGFWKFLGFFKIDEFLLKFWDGLLFKWV